MNACEVSFLCTSRRALAYMQIENSSSSNALYAITW